MFVISLETNGNQRDWSWRRIVASTHTSNNWGQEAHWLYFDIWTQPSQWCAGLCIHLWVCYWVCFWHYGKYTLFPSGSATETVPDTIKNVYPSGSTTNPVPKSVTETPEHEVPLVTTNDPEPSSVISLEQPVTVLPKHSYPNRVCKIPQSLDF